MAKKRKNYNMDNYIYDIWYKYTVTGGQPCETAAWLSAKVVAEDSSEAKVKLREHLQGDNETLECFTELTLVIDSYRRIGNVDVI